MDENNSGSMAAEEGGAQKTWISRDRKGCGGPAAPFPAVCPPSLVLLCQDHPTQTLWQDLRVPVVLALHVLVQTGGHWSHWVTRELPLSRSVIFARWHRGAGSAPCNNS